MGTRAEQLPDTQHENDSWVCLSQNKARAERAAARAAAEEARRQRERAKRAAEVKFWAMQSSITSALGISEETNADTLH